MFALTPIAASAEDYEMGESVTITITVEAYPLIDIEELCSKPDAPPECKVDANAEEKK